MPDPAPARSAARAAVVAASIVVVVLGVYLGAYALARTAGAVGWAPQPGIVSDRSVAGALATVFAPARLGERCWHRARNRRWLARNAARPGVTTTASGLQYDVIAASTNADARQPTRGDSVRVRYVGTCSDGTRFDASGADPMIFPVSGVIPGFAEAMTLMREGDRWRIVLPPDLAYGESGTLPKIGPDEILVFDVELVHVGDDEPR